MLAGDGRQYFLVRLRRCQLTKRYRCSWVILASCDLLNVPMPLIGGIFPRVEMLNFRGRRVALRWLCSRRWFRFLQYGVGFAWMAAAYLIVADRKKCTYCSKI